MTSPILRVKVLRRATVKTAALVKFPSDVTGTSPITVDTTGGGRNVGLSIDELQTSLDPLYAPIDAVGSGTAGQVAYYAAAGAAINGSPVVTIGAGLYGGLASHTNNLNVYPVNTANGIMLGYGTGSGNGEGGSVNYFSRNVDGSAPIIHQELGFEQAYWWTGASYNLVNTPLAIVFVTTEAQTATNQGSGVIFQIKTRGEANARGELSIAEGVTASINAASIQTGLGRGTINAEAGLYDNSNRALSASNLTATKNQTSNTTLNIVNSTNNVGASASFNANADVAVGGFGATATAYSDALLAGRAYAFGVANPIVVGTTGANPVVIGPNDTERARVLLGLMVGTTTDPGAGIVNVLTGYRIGNAAASGNVLRGNGTNFVSSTLAATDLSGLGTGVGTALGVNVGTDGAFVVKAGALGSPSSVGTMPALTLGGTVSGGGQAVNNLSTLAATTSLTSPLHIGGSGTTGTQLTLQTTSGNGTTDQIIAVGGNNGATRIYTGLGTGKLGVGSAAGAAVPTNTTFLVSNNVTTVDAALPIGATVMHLVGADGTFPAMVLDAFGATGLPFFGFRQAGGTAASKTASANTAFLGAFLGYGYDTTNGYSSGPQISLQTSEAWTNAAHGCNFKFFVVKNGTTAQIEIVRYQNSGATSFGSGAVGTDPGADGAILAADSIKSMGATAGAGYATGAGGTVTQGTNRTTGVTLNKVCGAITLFSQVNTAVSGATAQTFTVTNSAVAATDTVIVNQKSGTDSYLTFVTNVATGSFKITNYTTGGITNEAPVFNFTVIKGVAS